jgi:hypothetical protein
MPYTSHSILASGAPAHNPHSLFDVEDIKDWVLKKTDVSTPDNMASASSIVDRR